MAPGRFVLLAVFACVLPADAGVYKPPLGPWRPPSRLLGGAAGSSPAAAAAAGAGGRDLVSRCTLTWRNATLDHFSWASPGNGSATFPQRVFLCDEAWVAGPGGARGPVFLYLGNEADVTLYLNHTGLMWENAERFGALLVFAEHRYYGASKPWGAHVRRHMGYLTAEQALADYAELIRELKALPGAGGSPVVGFGGSYGGMLAAWMRLKYPHLLDGAVAASAPIWNFFDQDPPFDAGSFAAGVTYDASEAAGAPPGCADALRRAWRVLLELGSDAGGRTIINERMRLCPAARVNSSADVLALREYLAAAWDYLAMGDFPYPSSYMTNGAGELPAFPVRVACGHMTPPTTDGPSLMAGLAAAAGVLYNYSGTVECLAVGTGPSPESDEDSNFWDWQWCTEMIMPASKDGVNDMFWREPFNYSAALEACRSAWGVSPRGRSWAVTQWGGRRIASGSNIVFSNGLLDPWHGGGVLGDISDTLVAVVMPEGAHHLDLMFSHPRDPPCVRRARKAELRHIKRWVREASKLHPSQAAWQAWWEGQGAHAGWWREGEDGGQDGGGTWRAALAALLPRVRQAWSGASLRWRGRLRAGRSEV